MEKGLFRQKSIDRISSPEALHDYMRVTSPRLWMILAAVILLLVGFIVYASTVTLENTKAVRVQVEYYHMSEEQTGTGETADGFLITCSLPANQLEVVKTGMKLRIGENEGHVSWIYSSDDEDEITLIFTMDHISHPLTEGEYDAELVLETTTPISFLWN